MVESLEQTVAQFFSAEVRLTGEESILLAVSGGADSVAMLHIMHRLWETGRIPVSLVAAHVNHNLRSDSGRDLKLVQEQARRLGLPFLSRSVEVSEHSVQTKLSLETAARQLRLAALVEMARQADCSIVSTAHHADDNAETLLHRMLRGTGFRGLRGIEPIKQFHAWPEISFIRPLLWIKREQILAYCRKENLSWREDRTNRQTTYTRNRIRHSLIPWLQEEFGPGVQDKLSILSRRCRALHRKIQTETDLAWPRMIQARESGRISLHRPLFNRFPVPIRIEMIDHVLKILDIGLRKMTLSHYQAILSLASSNPAKEMDLPGGCRVIGSQESLIFETKHGIESVRFDTVSLSIPGQAICGSWRIEACVLDRNEVDPADFIRHKDRYVEWLDADQILGPFTLRKRRSGDRFCPFGLSGQKKVGKFLSSGGIPVSERKNVLVISDAKGIIWIAPFRIDQRCRISPETKKIVQLHIKPYSNI
ncbi:MAG: tRNA lysidine(34) synthetase TilS [Sedimentisphaerales bacterium]|nr:tRNA lysidine(34) synthetase TilS [Sedimentisphaerales bacterium]